MNGVITIAGGPGSGKSTASKAVAKELGLPHFSSGDLMRELGAERNLHILDTNHVAATDTELDDLVDGKLRDMSTKGDLVVIDSRMAWHWMPESLKVYLDMPDFGIAARRILDSMDADRQAREHIPSDPDEYAQQLRTRQSLEAQRYVSKYGVDPFDTTNFELVIDTEVTDIASTVRLIVGAYQAQRRVS